MAQLIMVMTNSVYFLVRSKNTLKTMSWIAWIALLPVAATGWAVFCPGRGDSKRLNQQDRAPVSKAGSGPNGFFFCFLTCCLASFLLSVSARLPWT